jgi:hypothetical protein
MSFASQVARICLDQLATLEDDHALIGPLSAGIICMPRFHRDKRKLTWAKFLGSTLPANMSRLYERINAAPPGVIEACWFYPVGSRDTNGYPSYKLSSRGSQNKHGIHRILFSLFNPDRTVRRDGLVLAHRCRNGMRDRAHDYACINPHHLVLVTQAVNISHNRCANGAPALCPHDPSCLWRDRTIGM